MSERTLSIHPGTLLLEEFLKPLNISQNRLARDIDVPVSRVAALVAGKRSITADTAMRLGTYFNTKPELWMKLQAAYELSMLRETDWPRIAARIRAYEPVDAQNAASPGQADTGERSNGRLDDQTLQASGTRSF
ncbi:MAG: HigA family addiction module antitoxin [Pseudomonadota bacterium]